MKELTDSDSAEADNTNRTHSESMAVLWVKLRAG